MEDLKNQKHYLIKFRNETINTKEIIDAILDSLELENSEAFDLGNALKYLIRFKNKNGKEDLRKVRVYVDYLLKESQDEIIEELKKRNIELENEITALEMETERLNNVIYNLNLEKSETGGANNE